MADDQIACRLGGEELAILMPQFDMAEATDFANMLCDAVRSMHLEHKGMSLGQLGVSIGVATYPNPASDTEALVKLADTALYMAKDQGRGRVVNYQEYSRLKSSNADVIQLEEKQR
ncbi:hypothetical protein JCM19233_3722 [Vibrio astriarenae]|nr:hypothetical protein JCM19233_3722 [Vibrio sp. C7]